MDAAQIDELQALYGAAVSAQEGGRPYLLLPNLQLPDGRSPALLDALLCPVPLGGYNSRLFLAQQIHAPQARNWSQHRILDRNWFVFSWKTPPGLRLAQMVAIHMKGLR